MAVPCQTEHGIELTSDRLTATTDNVGVGTEYVSLYSRAGGPYQAVLQLVLVHLPTWIIKSKFSPSLCDHFCDNPGEGISHLFGV